MYGTYRSNSFYYSPFRVNHFSMKKKKLVKKTEKKKVVHDDGTFEIVDIVVDSWVPDTSSYDSGSSYSDCSSSCDSGGGGDGGGGGGD